MLTVSYFPNNWVVYSLVIFLTGACAHEQSTKADVKAEIRNVEVSMPNLFQFSGSDIQALRAGMKGSMKSPKTFALSEKRTAKCKQNVCDITAPERPTLTVKSDDLSYLEKLRSKAVASGKEEIQKEGPVTLRCDSKRCAVDFFLEAEKLEATGQADVKHTPDYSSFFLGALIQGMAQGAVGGRP